MTYQAAAQFAQQGGAVYFLLMFLCGLAYACWPSNGPRFDKAARDIIDDEDKPWR